MWFSVLSWESKSPLERYTYFLKYNILLRSFVYEMVFKQMENDLNCFQHFWFLRITTWKNYERCRLMRVFVLFYYFAFILFCVEDIWGRLYELLSLNQVFVCWFIDQHLPKGMNVGCRLLHNGLLCPTVKFVKFKVHEYYKWELN